MAMQTETVKDEILICLQSYGRQSAREIAGRIKRPQKSVMRELANLFDLQAVEYDEIKVVRYIKLRRWGFKSETTRFYYLPIKNIKPDEKHKDILNFIGFK